MALKTVSGLWQSEKGYLSGKSKDPIAIPANTKFFIFKARERKTENHPTHTLAIAVDDEDEGQRHAETPGDAAPWETF